MLPVLWATLPTLGCSVILAPGEQQCSVDKDCAARGFADSAVCTAGVCEPQCVMDKDCAARGFASAVCTANVCKAVDPVWGCLGQVVEPVPDPTKTVTL